MRYNWKPKINPITLSIIIVIEEYADSTVIYLGFQIFIKGVLIGLNIKGISSLNNN